MRDTTASDTSTAQLILLIAGASPSANSARANLTNLVSGGDVGTPRIDIIDVFEQPQVALSYRTFFTPSLIVRTPAGTTTIVGDLVDIDEVRRLLASPAA